MQQMKIMLTESASEALDERAFDIANEYNVQAAESFLNHIEDALDTIQNHPFIGIMPEDIPHKRIYITSKKWQIPYKIEENLITVYPIFR